MSTSVVTTDWNVRRLMNSCSDAPMAGSNAATRIADANSCALHSGVHREHGSEQCNVVDPHHSCAGPHRLEARRDRCAIELLEGFGVPAGRFDDPPEEPLPARTDDDRAAERARQVAGVTEQRE